MPRWQRAHLCTENLLEGNSGVRELAEAKAGPPLTAASGAWSEAAQDEDLGGDWEGRTHALLDIHSFYLLIDLL